MASQRKQVEVSSVTVSLLAVRHAVGRPQFVIRMRPAAVSDFAPLGVDPFEDFGEGPDDATGRQIAELWEFALLFEFVDRRIGERHELAKLRPPVGSAPENVSRCDPFRIGRCDGGGG